MTRKILCHLSPLSRQLSLRVSETVHPEREKERETTSRYKFILHARAGIEFETRVSASTRRELYTSYTRPRWSNGENNALILTAVFLIRHAPLASEVGIYLSESSCVQRNRRIVLTFAPKDRVARARGSLYLPEIRPSREIITRNFERTSFSPRILLVIALASAQLNLALSSLRAN